MMADNQNIFINNPVSTAGLCIVKFFFSKDSYMYVASFLLIERSPGIVN